MGIEVSMFNLYIFLNANIQGEGVNPTILPPAMDKILWQTLFLNFGMATSLGEGKL